MRVGSVAHRNAKTRAAAGHPFQLFIVPATVPMLTRTIHFYRVCVVAFWAMSSQKIKTDPTLVGMPELGHLVDLTLEV